jgi:RHS repeat-associated protein
VSGTESANSAFGDVYKYTGREFDSETGLQYNRARYYDPRVGRWTSQDPLGSDAGDVNLYRYVANSPTLYIDPVGLDQEPVDTGIYYVAETPSLEHDSQSTPVDDGAGTHGTVSVLTNVYITRYLDSAGTNEDPDVKTPNGIFIDYIGTNAQNVHYYQFVKPVLMVQRAGGLSLEPHEFQGPLFGKVGKKQPRVVLPTGEESLDSPALPGEDPDTFAQGGLGKASEGMSWMLDAVGTGGRVRSAWLDKYRNQADV